MKHQLKIQPNFFEQVTNEYKTFELRFNDRAFGEGDILILSEWKDGEYTGEQVERKVTYILTSTLGRGLKKGWVILGLKVVEEI